MMLHVIRFQNAEDNETYGDSYLINLQNGVDNSSLALAYTYSPKLDCYVKHYWNNIRFAYFLDEKGHKYDRFLKRIKKNDSDNQSQ